MKILAGLRPLVMKNFIIMKRNIMQTIGQILFVFIVASFFAAFSRFLPKIKETESWKRRITLMTTQFDDVAHYMYDRFNTRYDNNTFEHMKLADDDNFSIFNNNDTYSINHNYNNSFLNARQDREALCVIPYNNPIGKLLKQALCHEVNCTKDFILEFADMRAVNHYNAQFKRYVDAECTAVLDLTHIDVKNPKYEKHGGVMRKVYNFSLRDAKLLDVESIGTQKMYNLRNDKDLWSDGVNSHLWDERLRSYFAISTMIRYIIAYYEGYGSQIDNSTTKFPNHNFDIVQQQQQQQQEQQQFVQEQQQEYDGDTISFTYIINNTNINTTWLNDDDDDNDNNNDINNHDLNIINNNNNLTLTLTPREVFNKMHLEFGSAPKIGFSDRDKKILRMAGITSGFIALAFAPMYLSLLVTMVKEKEFVIKPMLLLNGATPIAIQLSYIISQFVLLLPFLVIICAWAGVYSIAAVWKSFPWWISGLIFLSYTSAFSSFCMLMSCLFTRVKSAMMLGMFLYIFMTVPATVVELLPKLWSRIFAIVNLQSTLASFCATTNWFNMKVTGDGTPKDYTTWQILWKAPIYYQSLSPIGTIVIFFFQSILYTVLAIYIDNIIPGDYKVSYPWYYPILPQYWPWSYPPFSWLKTLQQWSLSFIQPTSINSSTNHVQQNNNNNNNIKQPQKESLNSPLLEEDEFNQSHHDVTSSSTIHQQRQQQHQQQSAFIEPLSPFEEKYLKGIVVTNLTKEFPQSAFGYGGGDDNNTGNSCWQRGICCWWRNQVRGDADLVEDFFMMQNNGNNNGFDYHHQQHQQKQQTDLSSETTTSSSTTTNGVRALDNLSITFLRGRINLLGGLNGGGKSTLINLISGLYKATSGDIEMYDRHGNKLSSIAEARIGICPQYNTLYDELTVLEHMFLYSELKQSAYGTFLTDLEMHLESSAILNRLKLNEMDDDYTYRLVGECSEGIKRRICFAISLLLNPDFLYLDECTSGQNCAVTQDVFRLLRQEKQLYYPSSFSNNPYYSSKDTNVDDVNNSTESGQQQQQQGGQHPAPIGKTIILVTHNMDEGDVIADRINVLAKGKLQCSGSSQFLKRVFDIGLSLQLDKDHHKLKEHEQQQQQSSSSQQQENQNTNINNNTNQTSMDDNNNGNNNTNDNTAETNDILGVIPHRKQFRYNNRNKSKITTSSGLYIDTTLQELLSRADYDLPPPPTTTTTASTTSTEQNDNLSVQNNSTNTSLYSLLNIHVDAYHSIIYTVPNHHSSELTSIMTIIENNQKKLKIKGLSLTYTTLNDVFLLANRQDHVGNGHNANTKTSLNTHYNAIYRQNTNHNLFSSTTTVPTQNTSPISPLTNKTNHHYVPFGLRFPNQIRQHLPHCKVLTNPPPTTFERFSHQFKLFRIQFNTLFRKRLYMALQDHKYLLIHIALPIVLILACFVWSQYYGRVPKDVVLNYSAFRQDTPVEYSVFTVGPQPQITNANAFAKALAGYNNSPHYYHTPSSSSPQIPLSTTPEFSSQSTESSIFNLDGDQIDNFSILGSLWNKIDNIIDYDPTQQQQQQQQQQQKSLETYPIGRDLDPFVSWDRHDADGSYNGRYTIDIDLLDPEIHRSRKFYTWENPRYWFSHIMQAERAPEHKMFEELDGFVLFNTTSLYSGFLAMSRFVEFISEQSGIEPIYFKQTMGVSTISTSTSIGQERLQLFYIVWLFVVEIYSLIIFPSSILRLIAVERQVGTNIGGGVESNGIGSLNTRWSGSTSHQQQKYDEKWIILRMAKLNKFAYYTAYTIFDVLLYYIAIFVWLIVGSLMRLPVLPAGILDIFGILYNNADSSTGIFYSSYDMYGAKLLFITLLFYPWLLCIACYATVFFFSSPMGMHLIGLGFIQTAGSLSLMYSNLFYGDIPLRKFSITSLLLIQNLFLGLTPFMNLIQSFITVYYYHIFPSIGVIDDDTPSSLWRNLRRLLWSTPTHVEPAQGSVLWLVLRNFIIFLLWVGLMALIEVFNEYNVVGYLRRWYIGDPQPLLFDLENAVNIGLHAKPHNDNDIINNNINNQNNNNNTPYNIHNTTNVTDPQTLARVQLLNKKRMIKDIVNKYRTYQKEKLQKKNSQQNQPINNTDTTTDNNSDNNEEERNIKRYVQNFIDSHPIIAHSLRKTYKNGQHVVLNDLYFKIPKNTIYCIVGPNGSGKSTIIKQLAGSLAMTPSAEERNNNITFHDAIINGQSLTTNIIKKDNILDDEQDQNIQQQQVHDDKTTNNNAIHREFTVGYCPQTLSHLDDNLTVFQTLWFYCRLHLSAVYEQPCTCHIKPPSNTDIDIGAGNQQGDDDGLDLDSFLNSPSSSSITTTTNNNNNNNDVELASSQQQPPSVAELHTLDTSTAINSSNTNAQEQQQQEQINIVIQNGRLIRSSSSSSSSSPPPDTTNLPSADSWIKLDSFDYNDSEAHISFSQEQQQQQQQGQQQEQQAYSQYFINRLHSNTYDPYDPTLFVLELLNTLDLLSARHRIVKHLSGGMRKRVAFAISLCAGAVGNSHGPDVLLLDDVASHCDPISRYKIQELLLSSFLQQTTICMTSHALKDEVEVLSDQIGVLGWPHGGSAGGGGMKRGNTHNVMNMNTNTLQQQTLQPSSQPIISSMSINNDNNNSSMIFQNTHDLQNITSTTTTTNDNSNNHDHITMAMANLMIARNTNTNNHHHLQHNSSFLNPLSHNNSILSSINDTSSIVYPQTLQNSQNTSLLPTSTVGEFYLEGKKNHIKSHFGQMYTITAQIKVGYEIFALVYMMSQLVNSLGNNFSANVNTSMMSDINFNNLHQNVIVDDQLALLVQQTLPSLNNDQKSDMTDSISSTNSNDTNHNQINIDNVTEYLANLNLTTLATSSQHDDNNNSSDDDISSTTSENSSDDDSDKFNNNNNNHITDEACMFLGNNIFSSLKFQQFLLQCQKHGIQYLQQHSSSSLYQSGHIKILIHKKCCNNSISSLFRKVENIIFDIPIQDCIITYSCAQPTIEDVYLDVLK